VLFLAKPLNNTGWQQVGNTFPTQRTALRPRVGKVLPTYNKLPPTANGEKA